MAQFRNPRILLNLRKVIVEDVLWPIDAKVIALYQALF